MRGCFWVTQHTNFAPSVAASDVTLSVGSALLIFFSPSLFGWGPSVCRTICFFWNRAIFCYRCCWPADHFITFPMRLLLPAFLSSPDSVSLSEVVLSGKPRWGHSSRAFSLYCALDSAIVPFLSVVFGSELLKGGAQFCGCENASADFFDFTLVDLFFVWFDHSALVFACRSDSTLQFCWD